jgi:hypothetical protein
MPPSTPSTTDDQTDAFTLGADLERRRLERRARELQRVLAVLGGRMRDDRVAGPALQRSIRDFGQQLNDVHAKLWRAPSGAPRL